MDNTDSNKTIEEQYYLQSEEQARHETQWYRKADYQEYIKAMEEKILLDDYEIAHSDADELLCSFLVDLGYWELVAAYYEVGKWYE